MLRGEDFTCIGVSVRTLHLAHASYRRSRYGTDSLGKFRRQIPI